jgi:predicted enzyme related to lactoylglutathione lyase
MANTVCHLEIFASDVERARAFYEQVFGWRFEAWGPPDLYLVAMGADGDPGVRNGVLARRDEALAEGGLNAFRCSISVRSLADCARAVERAGGKLRSPLIAIPNVGRYIEFTDPEGNTACIVEYEPGHPLAAR